MGHTRHRPEPFSEIVCALVLAATSVLFGACAVSGMPPTPDSFEALLAPAFALEPGAEIAIAWRNLKNRSTYQRSANLVVHAASTMKIAVMIEAFRRSDFGELPLDRPVLIKDEFASIADGSVYRLEAEDDGETTLYGALGETRTALELARLMMTHSSNLATNLLIESLGAANIQATIQDLGATRMKVLRGVQDIPAFEAGLNNVATARDLLLLLEAIALDRAASPASCADMREILSAQTFRDLIPAGLPAGTRVAHKTGSIEGIRHDAAIVYPEGRDPYILVVLTRGIADRERSTKLIADISRRIYEASLR